MYVSNIYTHTVGLSYKNEKGKYSDDSKNQIFAPDRKNGSRAMILSRSSNGFRPGRSPFRKWKARTHTHTHTQSQTFECRRRQKRSGGIYEQSHCMLLQHTTVRLFKSWSVWKVFQSNLERNIEQNIFQERVARPTPQNCSRVMNMNCSGNGFRPGAKNDLKQPFGVSKNQIFRPDPKIARA